MRGRQRLLSPHFKDFDPPPPSASGRYFARTRTKTAVVDDWEKRGARAKGTDGAELNKARARLTVVVLQVSR